MSLDPQTHVADLVSRHPATLRVFQRHGIDFCCGGKRPLAEVCAERHLPVEAVVAELETAIATTPVRDRDWQAAPLAELVDHILERYHGPLKTELPRLGQMADKVLRVHGDRHPEMVPPLVETLAGMSREIAGHLRDEEEVLFPAVRALESGDDGTPAAVGAAADLSAAIAGMEREHEAVGKALARLRQLSRDYTPPEGACNTFRGLFFGLAELEADLHRHIHLENNILFPRAARIGQPASCSV